MRSIAITSESAEQNLRSHARGGQTWLGHLSTCVLVVAIAAGGIAGGGVVLGLWRFSTIDTGSMRPVVQPGDVAVLRSEPLPSLHVGQIVAFHPPNEPSVTVIHRVVGIHHGPAGDAIATKGDANNARDQWRARLQGDQVWVEDAAIPKLGYLVVLTQMKAVRLLALLGLLGFGVVFGMKWIWHPEGPPQPKM